MRSVDVREKLEDIRAWLKRRGTGFLLAIAVELLVVIGLLTLWPPHIPQFAGQGSKTFQLFNAPGEQKKAAKQQQKQQQKVQRQAKAPPPQAQLVPPEAPPVPLTNIPGMITLSREDYAATDVSRYHSPKGEVASADSDAGGGSSGDSEAVGTAPNGEPLFAAEWLREPRQAELNTYMPKNTVGAGLIACKTAPRFHVVDCQILGDSPVGSGIARGARNAAWQFLVIPPRKGGKPLIGAWVRIEIDLTSR